MWPPTPEQREREDDEMRKSDRALARLACRVLGTYAGVDPHTMWILVQRVRAHVRLGTTEHEMLERLRP